jgi:hypothetical protein
MLADTIVHVEKVLLQGPERPSGNRRTTLPRQSRRGLLKGLRHAQTRKKKRPRGGLVVWLMAVIVISLAPAMHPIAADIAVLSLTAYAISAHTAANNGTTARPSFHARTGFQLRIFFQ